MKKSKLPLLAAMAAATALAATVTAAPASAKTTRASALSCNKTLDIGMLAPLTGGAGFLGQEQLSWAKLAVKTLPKTMGLKIKLVPGDAPVEQGPSAAQSVAQKFIADKNMVAVLGGSTSGSVAATSKALPAGRPRPGLVVRHAHDAHQGRQPGGHEAPSSASSRPTTTRARPTPTT